MLQMEGLMVVGGSRVDPEGFRGSLGVEASGESSGEEDTGERTMDRAGGQADAQGICEGPQAVWGGGGCGRGGGGGCTGL